MQGIVEKLLTASSQIAVEQRDCLPAQLLTSRGFTEFCKEFWKHRISERLWKSSHIRF